MGEGRYEVRFLQGVPNTQEQMETFIRTYDCEHELCDFFVKLFDLAPDQLKHPGYLGEQHEIPEKKKSTDLSMSFSNDKIVGTIYTQHLWDCVKKYSEDFPYAFLAFNMEIHDEYNIQKYKPNEAYFVEHIERCSSLDSYSHLRYLVFMTYLNDMPDEEDFDGGTYWRYQEFSLKPKKGTTVIWPADLTHPHQGIPGKVNDKYISTGWILLKQLEEKKQSSRTNDYNFKFK